VPVAQWARPLLIGDSDSACRVGGLRTLSGQGSNPGLEGILSARLG